MTEELTLKQNRSEKLSNLSRTHSAEEDNLDESSDDENLSKNSKVSNKIEKSKSTFNLNDYKYKKLNNIENNLKTTTIPTNVTRDINPLKSLLNNSELLEFVINPVPRNKVYQCTIIRDKKGLDRSLYPNYYMHLQTINSKDDNQQLKVEDFKDSSKKDENSNSDRANGSNILNGSSRTDTHLNNSTITNKNINQSTSNQLSNNDQLTNTNELHNRQVFLLSGRRRKKSKTYLISCNPFEITRENSIAKLRSNVIGTQFNTTRFLENNQRLDYATIIYVS